MAQFALSMKARLYNLNYNLEKLSINSDKYSLIVKKMLGSFSWFLPEMRAW